ncbi:hypothetical protein BKA82DRAFT_1006734, partial [Pisolithus tinctorius]
MVKEVIVIQWLHASFLLRLRPNSLEALSIYNQINFLPPAHFATRRLHLPGTVFSARRLVIQGL